MLKIKLLSVRKIREHVPERSGGNRERSNIMLRATGGAECSNRGERVFKYTPPHYTLVRVVLRVSSYY